MSAALMLIAAVAVVFSPTLFNGFVHDDHSLVERNPVVRTLDPATHFGSDFWSRDDPTHAYYRPLVSWSLAWNRAMHGVVPWSYHLFNILVHAGSVALLFLILRRLRCRTVAWLGAGIFALHPVQVESVAWVMGRTDLLSGFFLLLGLWFHVGLPERWTRGGALRLLCAALAGFAALLCKESAAVFPALFLAADLARYRADGDTWRQTLRRGTARLLRVVPFYVLVVVAYLALRVAVTGQLIGPAEAADVDSLNRLLGASVGFRWLNSVVVAGHYLLLVAFPLRLSIDYQFDVFPLASGVASAAFLLPLLGVAAAAGLAAWIARVRPAGLFGLLAAACAYLPVSHLVFAVPILMAERFLYLPMIGISVLIASGVALLAERFTEGSRQTRAMLALGIVLLAVGGARSLVRTFEWKDDFALFSSAVRVKPRSVRSLHNLGFTYGSRGDLDSALESYDRALGIEPRFLPSRLNRVATLRRMGRFEQAAAEASGLAAEHPESTRAAMELIEALEARAVELESRGETETARGIREQVIENGLVAGGADSSAPAGVKAVILVTAAENLTAIGRVEEAERTFRQAVQQAERELSEGGAVPEAAQGVRALVHSSAADFFRRQALWHNAAEGYEAAAEASAAAGQPDTASRMTVNAVEAWRRAAEEALAQERPDQAAAFYDRLLERDPSRKRARHARARTRLALGDAGGAETDLQRLLDEGPTKRQEVVLWIDLAIAASLRGDREQESARLNHALELEPAHAEALYRRDMLQMQANPQE